VVGVELDLPDEVYGFGSWLLWLLATRATRAVDQAFAAGPARPSRHYGVVDGHPVPTPSLVAWLLTAAEHGVPLDQLAQRDRRVSERQKVLRTIVSRAIGGEPHLFKESWLRDLTAVCGLSEPELRLLARSRDEEGYPVDPSALRQAIARTLRERAASGRDGAGRGGPGTVAPGGAAGGVAAATRTLPRDIASFTGRESQLQQLTAAAAGGVMSIYAVGGMAGVGKTAFAVHAAHRLAPRFPDGQVFLPLHGHTPGQAPVSPLDALASLLQISGVEPGQIPDGLEARMALWRDRLAGKQLLLLLDDAVGSEQVSPLLPGTGGSLVLVTSRRHLTALEDAQPVSLDTLPPEEAAALLVRLAARPGLGPGDAAVTEITRLCGCLPLAIGMLARQLHHHPAWTAADLAADLAATRDRLELMQAENLSVAAAFDLSYQDLTPGRRRLFRRLGLHPGTETDRYAAAALGGIPLREAAGCLEALYDHYLIAEPARGRYRLHDLIREHARALAGTDPPDERDAAAGQLLVYYQHTADLAEELLARQHRTGADPAAVTVPPTAVPDLPDRMAALAWLRAERTNLLACLDEVTRTGQHTRIVRLTAGISALLRQDGPWTDAVTRHTAAVQAARQISDRPGEVGALLDLGDARQLTCAYPDAVTVLQEALAVSRDIGDRQGEANALLDLAPVRLQTGDYPAAAWALEEALRIHRDLGDRLGEANSLLDLGVVRRMIGDCAASAADAQAALRIYRELGDRRNQGNALNDLGDARLDTADYPRAIEAYQEALAIFRDLGNRKGQANSLASLGTAWLDTGDYPRATVTLEEAVSIYRSMEDQLGLGNTLKDLANVRRKTRDYAGAAQMLEEALGICRDIGYRLGEANALSYLAAVWRVTGDQPGATRAFDEALGIYRAIGNRFGEADVLNEIGTLHRIRGDLDQAATYHRRALHLAREINSPPIHGRALAGLGRCALAGGRTADARDVLRQAHKVFQRTGAAEAAEVAAELSALAGPAPTA
jgi:tetratricopeptide (TPR) repeat protein